MNWHIFNVIWDMMLLLMILALTSFAHLAMFCQHPESSLASIVTMCCRRHVNTPFCTTCTTRIISSPAMSAPSWCDRHSACCEIKKRIISLPAMSVPSWRDRHSACCEIKKRFISSPAMSAPSWRDRHLACCEIQKRIISSPAMSVPSCCDRHLACCQII